MRQLLLSTFFTLTLFVSSTAQDLKAIEGSWIAEIHSYSSFDSRSEASLTMKWQSNGERFRYTFSVPIDQLQSGPDAGAQDDDASFNLEREAGTLLFEGEIADDMGSGKFTFTANPEFLEEMQSLGYTNISADEQLKMTIHDVTTAFVRKIRDVSSATES